MIFGSKNKGDWSEFYALLYLLGTRVLYGADENLNKISDEGFPINKIMRHDKVDCPVDYLLEGENLVEIYQNSTLMRTMTSDEFRNEAAILKDEIVASTGGSFDIAHGEALLNHIFLERLGAPSTQVTDLVMELHDIISNRDQVMGFSIKSYLGGNPTLLNASEATNFVYKVNNLSSTDMDEINAIDTRKKIKDRIAKIYEKGGTIKFDHTNNDIFSANLMMVDSMMEDIVAALLLDSYTSDENKCANLIQRLENDNPLGYPRSGMYVYKFKKFLCAKALGMDPSVDWNGFDDANGGYIVVKSDGDVLAYHLYNRDKFEQYLYDSTKLERGSTSKHKYASLYEEAGQMYIKLNLQIRFL